VRGQDDLPMSSPTVSTIAITAPWIRPKISRGQNLSQVAGCSPAAFATASQLKRKSVYTQDFKFLSPSQQLAVLS
jgi:hypothetical protein